MLLQAKYFTVMLIFTNNLFISGLSAQKCQVSISTDMGSRAPLLVSAADGKTILIPTDKSGNFEMNHGELIYLACPGTTNSVVLTKERTSYSTTMVLAKCNKEQSFFINGETQLQSISNIECRVYPASYTAVVGTCAENQGKLIEIGFQFNSNKDSGILVCFDEEIKKTYWTKALVIGDYCQAGDTDFRKDYFGTINPDDRYRHQKQSIPDPYADRNSFDKGHLVARCDFMGAAVQRMTYYYINAAPQWASFNRGNWRRLEQAVRKEAERRSYGLYVYTGTHDILTLNNKTITLDTTRNMMPVPLYFWKVVIEPQTGNGIAFIGVNDLFNEHDFLCTDICNKASWLQNLETNRNEKDKGMVYCCEISNFKAIPNIELPQFLEYKGGILISSS